MHQAKVYQPSVAKNGGMTRLVPDPAYLQTPAELHPLARLRLTLIVALLQRFRAAQYLSSRLQR